MKRTLFIIISCLCVVCAEAGFLSGMVSHYMFYPTHSFGFNGGIAVYNDGGTTVTIISGSSVTFGNAPTAAFVRELASGDALYRYSGPYGKVEYVVSPDKEHLCQVSYMGDEWTFTTWYTISKKEQLAFYAANRDYQTNGITFDYSWNESSSGSTNSHSNIKKKSSCSRCHGTGIDPTPVQCYGYASWLAEYNHEGNKCRICNKYTQHYHTRCSTCNAPDH